MSFGGMYFVSSITEMGYDILIRSSIFGIRQTYLFMPIGEIDFSDAWIPNKGGFGSG